VNIFIKIKQSYMNSPVVKKRRFLGSHIAAVLLLVLFCKSFYAQTANKNTPFFSCSNRDCLVSVDYQPEGAVANLLVQISDSGGRTIFLENKHKVSGNYHCTFNASEWKGGVVYVQLIADDKHFNEKIKLK
jgi:hypothetical protein